MLFSLRDPEANPLGKSLQLCGKDNANAFTSN